MQAARALTLPLFVALAVAACAPFQRLALKRCPTVYASFVDFTITAAAMGVSVLAMNAGRETRAVTWAGAGGIVAVASNVAECQR